MLLPSVVLCAMSSGYVVRGSSCILVAGSDDAAAAWWCCCGESGVFGDGGSVTSADLWCGVCCMTVCSCWIGVSRVVWAVAACACPGMS